MIHARLIKPHGFDATKKSPVIVYLYNGPHVQLVTNSLLGGASPWMLQARSADTWCSRWMGTGPRTAARF